MCNCINGRQCTWCFLGQAMKVREQMRQEIVLRSANVPLIEDETDYEALINEATNEYNEASQKVIQVNFKSKQRMN